jgi:hypothetical protein
VQQVHASLRQRAAAVEPVAGKRGPDLRRPGRAMQVDGQAAAAAPHDQAGRPVEQQAERAGGAVLQQEHHLLPPLRVVEHRGRGRRGQQ